MSGACPQCGAALPADFGMITCSSCAALVFLDMDGNAHFGNTLEPNSPDPDPSPVHAEQLLELGPALLPELAPAPLAEIAPEPAMDNDFFSLGDEAERLQPAEEFSPSPDSGDPLGLNAFANSEVSQAKDGPFLYKVLISGIDSKEMRETIREAMTDARFGWDVGQLMASLSKGRLEIDRLAPVKASVLVNRLKRLPIQIRWEQYAVSQLEDSQPGEFEKP